MKKGEITSDTTKIQKIIRDYYKQLYANKMDNLKEMDKYLEKYNLPSLNQEAIENMNRPFTSNEIKTVIKNLPTNKSPGLDSFTGEFYQAFRYKLTLILLKLFQKLQREEYPQTHSMKPLSLWCQNQTKYYIKRKITVQYHLRT